MQNDDDYRIRQRAYDLWEEAGRPDGKHLEFWNAAEQEVRVGGVKSKELDTAAAAESLDEGLADTFPASDPLSETSPGGPRTE
jgi:hypothetical protein